MEVAVNNEQEQGRDRDPDQAVVMPNLATTQPDQTERIDEEADNGQKGNGAEVVRKINIVVMRTGSNRPRKRRRMPGESEVRHSLLRTLRSLP